MENIRNLYINIFRSWLLAALFFSVMCGTIPSVLQKKIKMNNFVYHFFFFLIFSLDVKSQRINDLSIWLSVQPNISEGIDPLQFNVTLINKTKKKFSVRIPWYQDTTKVNSGVYISYEIRSDKENKEKGWMKLFEPRSHLPEGAFPIELLGNDSISTEFYSIPISAQLIGQSYRYNPLPAGKYKIRAVYYPFDRSNHKNAVYSNEFSFSIADYQGEDKEAYEWLLTLPFPHFIYETAYCGFEKWGFISSLLISRNNEYAEELLRKFPDSKFSGWAKLHLAYCYRFGIVTGDANKPIVKDVEKAESLAKEVFEKSSGLLNFRAKEFLLKSKTTTRQN